MLYRINSLDLRIIFVI